MISGCLELAGTGKLELIQISCWVALKSLLISWDDGALSSINENSSKPL